MNPFQYVTATSPDEAPQLLGRNGRYLAGGVDLLGEMKEYIVSPDILVNVKEVFAAKKANSIVFADDKWTFDTVATVAAIAAHEQVRKDLSGLAEAAGEVGSPQIRNVASLGGNLLQHSRCWYYRQPDITCLKRGGSTCYGQEGENKYLALMSGCACISPIVSNLAVMLAALDATAHIQRKGKLQPLTMTELYHEAWKTPTAHNSLSPHDFLVHITVPSKRRKSAYRQQSEKREFDWALASCAAAGNVSDGKITDARVALGAIAPVPYIVEEANHFLEGKTLNEETVSKAADLILKDAKPLAQNGYKVPLAHALIRRTLLALNT